MTELKDDLRQNPNEHFLRSDLIEGVKLILREMAEAGGHLTLLLALMKVLALLSGVFSWFGLVLAPAVAQRIMTVAIRRYARASEADQKKIRAFASWINGGFSFGRFHTPETYEKIIGVANIAEEARDVLTKLARNQ